MLSSGVASSATATTYLVYEPQTAGLSVLNAASLRVYCRLSSFLNDANEKCYKKVKVAATNSANVVDWSTASVASWAGSDNEATANQNTSQSGQTIFQYVPQIIERLVYAQGPKGEKGDPGQPGVAGQAGLTTNSNLPFFGAGGIVSGGGGVGPQGLTGPQGPPGPPGTGSATTSDFIDLTAINATTTNATSTYFFSTALTAVSGFFTNLVATNASTTNFAVTGSATSTFGGGIDLASGCFSVGGICIGNGGSGISTLNGLIASTQTFATGTTGTDFNIVSSGSTHTFNLPNAGASARGLVSTSTQTFAGTKIFSDIFATNATTTNATSTNFFASLLNATTALFTSFNAINGTSTNFVATNATTSNLAVTGTVALPASSITNSNLVNASIIVATSTGVSGGGTVALGGTVNVGLTSTGVTPGSFNTFTVDAQGRLTAASTTTYLTSALTSLNGLTGPIQIFSTSSTGNDFTITSTGATHTFNLPDASATARGLVTTAAQIFSGTKTFSDIIATNASSTNFFASIFNATTGLIGTLSGTNAIFTNASTTNATSTNVFTSNLRATTADLTTLTASTATVSDFIATRATTTDATSTNLYISSTLRGAGLSNCVDPSGKLLWDATTGRFTCGTDAGAGGGITGLNGLITSTQTFATGSDTNIGLTIISSGSTHTFTPTFTGTLADARVADNLTISGGTIDNTPIGATTASTAKFTFSSSTNMYATNASTTNFTATGTAYFTSLSAGSVPFIGTGGLLSQNNTNFAWNNGTNRLTVTSGSIYSASGVMIADGTAASPGFQSASNGNNGMWFPTNAVAFSTQGTEKFRIDPNGLVGIGTTSPFAKLSISANTSDTNTTIFNISSSTPTATTTLFTVTNTGKVGVGTANPLALLNVSGAGASASAILVDNNTFYSSRNSANSGNFRIFGLNASNQVAFGDIDQAGGGIGLYGSGSNFWTLNSSGHLAPGADNTFDLGASGNRIRTGYFGTSIAIGTTTPAGTLAVVGNIFASSTATSTFFGNGINLPNGGCFAVSGVCVGSGGSGLTSLNGLTNGTQTFATGTADTNIQMTIISSGSTHTFSPTFVGTLADARVADNLTISGGTIDNTPIGATTASTAKFTFSSSTNMYATNASTTNISATGTILVQQTAITSGALLFGVQENGVDKFGFRDSNNGELLIQAKSPNAQTVVITPRNSTTGAPSFTGSGGAPYSFDAGLNLAANLSLGTAIGTNNDTVLSRSAANTLRLSSDGANGLASLVVNSKFGLGTTTPFAKFSIQANAADPSTPYLFAIASSTLTSTTTQLVFTNMGYLGIGTTSPSSALGLVGNIIATSSATSSFYGGFGFNLVNGGCFAVSGVCVGNVVGGSGLTSLNGLTGATQTFATSTAGVDFTITSVGTTHTFNFPDAGASARGLVSTSTQTFAGAKTFTATTTLATTTLTGFTSGSIPFIGTTGALAENNTSLFWSVASSSLVVGGGTALPNSPFHVGGSVDNYLQGNIQNRSAGASASSDWVATANNGTDTTNYVDMGINSSGYSDPAFTITSALDSYLYSNGGNLAIGAQSANKVVKFFTGGTLASNERMRIDTNGLVGIGTTTPYAKFSIHANATDPATPYLFVIASSTSAATTTQLVFTNTGYLGIGTSTPAAQFSLGTISASSTFVYFASGTQPILRIGNDIVDPLDPYHVVIGGSTASSTLDKIGQRDQLYVFGRLNTSWNFQFEDCLVSRTAATAGIYGAFWFNRSAAAPQIANLLTNNGASGVCRMNFSAATINTTGHYGTNGNVFNRSLNPVLETRAFPNSAVDQRVIVGFSAYSSALSIVTDTNQDGNEAFFRKNASSTNWDTVTRGGGGTETVTAGVASTTATSTLRVELDNVASSTRFYVNGQLVATHTTGLPAPFTMMGAYISTNITSANVRNFDFDYLRLWADDPPYDTSLSGGLSSEGTPEPVLSPEEQKIKDDLERITNQNNLFAGMTLGNVLTAESLGGLNDDEARPAMIRFAERLFKGIGGIFDVAKSEITSLYVKYFSAKQVKTEKLCLDDVCISKSELQALLHNAQIDALSPDNATSTPTSTPVIIPPSSGDTSTPPPTDTGTTTPPVGDGTTTPPTDGTTTPPDTGAPTADTGETTPPSDQGTPTPPDVQP